MRTQQLFVLVGVALIAPLAAGADPPTLGAAPAYTANGHHAAYDRNC